MNVVEINSVKYGSTGNIALDIIQRIESSGDNSAMFVPKGRHNGYKNMKNIFVFGGAFSEDCHIILGRLTGLSGLFSVFATMQLVSKIKKINPDIVHLHNLHNSYLNYIILFDFLRKNSIPVVWTFHDCWPFTGHCPHFTFERCIKWEKSCYSCPQYREYPKCWFDDSRLQYKIKKKCFLSVKNLHIVSPSNWLKSKIDISFFKGNDVRVINNGIDLSIFCRRQSNFREMYRIGTEKKLILGVAMGWSTKKGLDTFIRLANELDNQKFQIVLVGTSEHIDKILPQTIISIHRTTDQIELSKIYSAADIFLNPTLEEVFGLVNIEALACGTPVVMYNTCGSPECIDDSCGMIIEYGNYSELKKYLESIVQYIPFTHENCIRRAQHFSKTKCVEEYYELFKSLTEKNKRQPQPIQDFL